MVNNAPADVRKEGPVYDLPIALGVLVMSGFIPPETVQDALVIGELSLDGGIRHVRGVLPMAAIAREAGFKRFFAPQVDAPEAALIPDVDIIPVVSLASLHAHLTGGDQIPVMEYTLPEDLPLDLITTDFAEIKTRFVLNLLSEIMDAWFENRAFFSCYTL